MKMRRITESKWTSDLLAMLREGLGPMYSVLKHSDRFTENIPDFSVSNDGRTIWVEVKVLRKPDHSLANPHHYVDQPAQLHLCSKLRGWYLVHDPWVGVTLLTPAVALEAQYQGIRDSGAARYIPNSKLVEEMIKFFYGGQA